MRLRLTVLACALGTVALMLPGIASAAPHHNRGLTIRAIPNRILAGEGVLIYGQLHRGPVAGQRIVLFHHIAGTGPGYTRISATTTDSRGFYEFTRAEGVVMTNRRWFVREEGVHRIHSRTTREQVAALVNLMSSSPIGSTRDPILFSGHVEPGHRFELILLQQQNGARNAWRTIDRTRLGAGSNFAVAYRFRVPGAHLIRAAFRGDHRNARGVSDSVEVTIEQAQVPDFTIHTSDPIIPFEGSATISGTLYKRGTRQPQANAPVTLCGRTSGQPVQMCDNATVADGSGNYSFTVTPVANEVYRVRAALTPHRHTARLFEGVSDIVALGADNTSVKVGQPVTFTGTVSPNKTGDPVYLQRLGADDDWHTVAIGEVGGGSRFTFVRTFGTPGTKRLRARVPGDGTNVGGASGAVTVTVTLPAVSTLPPAS